MKGLASLALLLLFSPAILADTVVYVALASEKKIVVHRMSDDDGKLTHIDETAMAGEPARLWQWPARPMEQRRTFSWCTFFPILHEFQHRFAHRLANAVEPDRAAEAASPQKLAGTRPNIILIITDDQGYGDLSCHGNPILNTPNIDKLYARSVRFTDFHVSPTCAPTRAALMTGRHEFKSGVTHTINERERLNPLAFTVAQLLKLAGYITGIFGKWHLGEEAAYQPNRRGFDEVFIHGAGGIGQTYPGSCGDAPGNKYFDPVI